jgi:NAD(P)-dependent dehydrogenase (short-subunit alcohol dehydrogenase family)
MKKILITGSAGGLGKVCCDNFIHKGYKVYGTVSPGKLNLVNAGNELLEYKELDLLSEQNVTGLFETFKSDGISLNAVALLAGGFAMGNLEKTDEALMKKMIDQNFFTAYHVCRQAIMHFKANKIAGCFIFISSQTAAEPKTGINYTAYTLSKAMLHTLSELIFNEGQSIGIRTHILVPGILDTAANKKSMPDADQQSWTKISEMAEIMYNLVENQGTQQSIINL